MKLKQAFGKRHAKGGFSILLICTAWKDRGPRLIQKLQMVASYLNTSTPDIRVRLVNSYMWPRVPERGSRNTGFTRDDLHRATNISLSLSTYDTFTISPLKLLSCCATVAVSNRGECARKIAELLEYKQNILVASSGGNLRQLVIGDDAPTTVLRTTHSPKESLDEGITKSLTEMLYFMVQSGRKLTVAAIEREMGLANFFPPYDMLRYMFKWLLR
jgi:hypothetical protein